MSDPGPQLSLRQGGTELRYTPSAGSQLIGTQRQSFDPLDSGQECCGKWSKIGLS